MNDRNPVSKRSVETTNLESNDTALSPRVFDEYIEIVRSSGGCVDDKSGTEFLDAIAGNQCSNIGQGWKKSRRQRTNRSSKSNTPRVSSSSTISYSGSPPGWAEFLPSKFNHTRTVSGGSEANESAIKMARGYHVQAGDPEKNIATRRPLSYRGNTLGTMRFGEVTGRRRPSVPMPNDWPKVPTAYPYHCQHCASEDECREHGPQRAKELEQVIWDTKAKYVSAFIPTPVVGAANAAAVSGDDYFETIGGICDKYEVLLITDEGMSVGVGQVRTFPPNTGTSSWTTSRARKV